MKRLTRIVIPVLILAAGYLAMSGLFSLRTESPKRAPEVPSKLVATRIVTLQPVATEVVAYGRVVTAQPVQLYAEATGTLQPGVIPFQPAQSFSKGDLLLKIDDRQARLSLNSKQSELLAALASVLPEIKIDSPVEYQVWQDYFDNLQFDRKIADLPKTDNSRIKLFLSRFNVYKLYFSTCDLEILLEKHYLYAPFDGSIVSAPLRVGSTARNGTLLGELINLEQMEVAVPVEAEDIYWIDRDKPVTFTSSETGGRWRGEIARIGSTIDTRTQTVDVYLSIENGQTVSLLDGVFLEANMPGRTIENAYPVPPRAIYEDRYVYLIVDGRLERRDINILRRETNQVVVDRGLNDGDTLVVEIMQGVAPGMPARPKVVATETRGQ